MKNKDFTDHILVCGAVWFSLLAGGMIIIISCDLFQAIRDWRSVALWNNWNEMSRWLHIPLSVLMVVFLIALVAALWRRIIARRRVLAAASTTQFSAAISQKKYAFWSSRHHPTRQRATFSKTQLCKKIKR